MRSFKTMLVVIAYVAALLLLALAFLGSFIPDAVYLNTMTRGPMCYLALLIVCGLPVMSLCLLTGGVSLGQILIGELFLLAEAFACVSIGVFCSSVARSTVLSGVLSYLVIILVGVITALPFLFGYPQSITDVVYDRPLYAALTPGEARLMISPLLYMNPGFGLLSLVQGELHVLTSYTEYLGWGRILCTWRMADRAGWIFISLASAAGMLVIAAILIGLASMMIRKGHKTKSNG